MKKFFKKVTSLFSKTQQKSKRKRIRKVLVPISGNGTTRGRPLSVLALNVQGSIVSALDLTLPRSKGEVLKSLVPEMQTYAKKNWQNVLGRLLSEGTVSHGPGATRGAKVTYLRANQPST